MVAFFGVALLNQNETTVNVRLIVQFQDGVSGCARTRERVEHNAFGAAPDLNDFS